MTYTSNKEYYIKLSSYRWLLVLGFWKEIESIADIGKTCWGSLSFALNQENCC